MVECHVAVLLGAGLDPVSSTPRRGALDARALEMGLQLAGDSVLALHAGDPGEPSMVEYLGMGVPAIEVLAWSGGVGLAQGLGEVLRRRRCGLVLAGARSDVGAGSGVLPYAVAAALGATLVPHVTAIERSRDHVRCVIAAGPGERRVVCAPLPAVATVGMAAPIPRPFAYGRARRGVIRRQGSIAIRARPVPHGDDDVPRRLRPKYLDVVQGKTAWSRIRQVIGERQPAGRQLRNATPDAAAEALLAFMAASGVWQSNRETQPSEEHSDGNPVL